MEMHGNSTGTVVSVCDFVGPILDSPSSAPQSVQLVPLPHTEVHSSFHFTSSLLHCIWFHEVCFLLVHFILSLSLTLSLYPSLSLSLSAPLRPFSPKPLFPISALLSPWTRTRRRSRTNTFHRKKNFEKKVASRKLFSQHRYFQNKLNSSERWEGTSPGWFSNFVSSVATFILSIVTFNLGNYFQFRIRLCITSLCRSLYYFPFFSHNSIKQYIMK